jgi:hypothetical protein
MTISPYFHHISGEGERGLMKDLVRETIFLKGSDISYIPRDSRGADYLWGEDIQSTFTDAVTIEMYCTENRIQAGQDIMSKFGIQVQDESTFIVSKHRFDEVITAVYPDIKRPREGDIIYYPVTRSAWEITFAEDEIPFYVKGIQTVWIVSTRKFEANYDIMDSKVPDVDFVDNKENEPFDDKTDIQEEADTFVDFSEADPFSTNSY